MKNLELSTLLNYNHFAINKNLEGITQEESLTNPQKGGNSINMVLGHLVVARDSMLKAFGIEGICGEKMGKMYAQKAPPLKAEEAVGINELLNMYNESQERIINVLPEQDLSKDEEKIKNLVGLAFHEAYHAGQIGILRRIIGKEGLI